MSASKIVLCTGANKGLGYCILEAAGLREPSSVYILACRTVSNGDEAVKKLRDSGVKADIEVLQLDVTNDEHIEAAVNFVETKYGKLDVLINNAAVLLSTPPSSSLCTLRQIYTLHLSTNLTSVVIITTAFLPLLHKSPTPKVINVTSGLGSIQNSLSKKLNRLTSYGSSKVGMNGATMHMQTEENDRVVAEEQKGVGRKEGRIRFYVVQPGLLKTDLASILVGGGDPRDGAEVVVRLVMDDEGTYPGGTYWEFVAGEMREVPW